MLWRSEKNQKVSLKSLARLLPVSKVLRHFTSFGKRCMVLSTPPQDGSFFSNFRVKNYKNPWNHQLLYNTVGKQTFLHFLTGSGSPLTWRSLGNSRPWRFQHSTPTTCQKKPRSLRVADFFPRSICAPYPSECFEENDSIFDVLFFFFKRWEYCKLLSNELIGILQFAKA